MHPALSVIIFTVLSGAGFGLISLTALLDAFGPARLLTAQEVVVAGVLAIILATVGLLSSTLHLANPKNAWRAFFRFRTSWLSREAVFSVLFYPFALAFVAGVWLQGEERGALVALAGVIAAALAIATVFCTGMIYASLRTIRQWNTPLVPTNYLLLSFAAGALSLLSVSASLRGGSELLVALSLTLVIAAAVGKSVYFFWIGKPAGPTINTATGMTRGQVRLLEAGQSAANFSNNEFNFQVAAQRLQRLRLVVYLIGFALPLALLVWMWRVEAAPVAVLALLATLLGMGVERWLFFAEARHVVNLFYGRQQC
jgi:DMSO reductase anchor subunit